MIAAELRRLHSPDAPDLKMYAPEDPGHFGLLVQAMIGPSGMPGEESFDFMVCTPRWLAERLSQVQYVLGRHYLFVNEFDLDLIQEALSEICRAAVGPNWDSVAGYLARFGRWEFEDYQPHGS